MSWIQLSIDHHVLKEHLESFTDLMIVNHESCLPFSILPCSLAHLDAADYVSLIQSKHESMCFAILQQI